MRPIVARSRRASGTFAILLACAAATAVGVSCSQKGGETPGGPSPLGSSSEGVGGGNGVTPAPAGGGNGNSNGNSNSASGPTGGVGGGNDPVVSPSPVAQAPNGPAVQYIGRFDVETNPNLPTMAWPSSQLLVGFDGTKLTVTLNSLDQKNYSGVRQHPYVAATVDGGNETVYKLADGTSAYVVAQNLPAGHHVVRLTLRTEAQVGRVGFVGAASDGKLTYTPPVAQRRIAFLGDSGLCGYGADGNWNLTSCGFSDATENGAVAFPNLVGLMLGAEVQNLSYSGKGLVENRDMVDDAEKTLPVLWGRTLPYDDPDAAWDPNRWRPQVVVLVTGGNDFYNEIPNASLFVNTVKAFVTKLKATAPGVVVFTAVSPMLRVDGNPESDPTGAAGKRTTAIAYMQRAATESADPNVRYLDIPGPDTDDPNSPLGANGFGCDQHLNAVSHRKVAASVSAAIKASMGW